MKKAWFKIDPGLLEMIKREIRSAYPNLHVYVENGTVFIRGAFPITFENEVLDRYLVEIEFPSDYPESIPIVRETGGRIPRTLHSHMISDAGQCCLFLPDERWEVYPKGSSFLDFLNGPVRNFFLGQSMVRLGQSWPFGERAHGVNGVFEYYEGLLGTADLPTILNYLLYLSKPEIKGHWPCLCGSGKRLRNCHFERLIDLRQKIPQHVATRSLIRILAGLKVAQNHSEFSDPFTNNKETHFLTNGIV
jgi:hypothetical protein